MLFAKFDLASAQAFGAALRLARLGANETQIDLAARVGLTPKRLGLIERGRCAVRLRERAALCEAFPVLGKIVPRVQPRPLVSGVPTAAEPEPAS
jgi:transcriptional regulator with XRE-family HTH domain